MKPTLALLTLSALWLALAAGVVSLPEVAGLAGAVCGLALWWGRGLKG